MKNRLRNRFCYNYSFFRKYGKKSTPHVSTVGVTRGVLYRVVRHKFYSSRSMTNQSFWIIVRHQ
ncbi:MAG TPA: hypothetical protein ENH75_13395 [archaeon]|nr:hypothetical protein [archaeon]